MDKGIIKTVLLSKIIIPEGREPGSHLFDLIQSIEKLGILNPPTITTDYVLVAGRNRVEAARILVMKKIRVNMVDCDKITAELAEIDENIQRKNLSVLERCIHQKRRKEILASLGKISKKGGDQKSKKAKKIKTQKLRTDSYGKLQSEATGKSKRTIEEEVRIGKDLRDEVVEKLKKTALADRKTDLQKISRLSAKEQNELAEIAQKKKAKSFAEAKKHLHVVPSAPKSDPTIVPRVLKELECVLSIKNNICESSDHIDDILTESERCRDDLRRAGRDVLTEIQNLKSVADTFCGKLEKLGKSMQQVLKSRRKKKSKPSKKVKKK